MVPTGRGEEESFARPLEEEPDSNDTVSLSFNEDNDKNTCGGRTKIVFVSAIRYFYCNW